MPVIIDINSLKNIRGTAITVVAQSRCFSSLTVNWHRFLERLFSCSTIFLNDLWSPENSRLESSRMHSTSQNAPSFLKEQKMNIMKIAFGVIALLPICEIALAQVKPSNPSRWIEPIRRQGRVDDRCLQNPNKPDPGGSDSIPASSSLAAQRVDWATIVCEHIHPKLKKKFTHYYDAIEDKVLPYPHGKMLFPSFAEDDSRKAPGSQIYKVWKPDTRTCSRSVPGRNEPAIWYTICQQGCYPSGQSVKFDKGRYLDIADAVANDAKYVTVIDRNSSIENPRFRQLEVSSYTADRNEAEQELIEFVTDSGKSIEVTPNHFLVVGDGRVVEAQLIKEGSSLLNQFGKPEKIVSIRENKDYFGRTYNVSPKSHDPLDNIVVAQGFLSGSHRYQSGTISSLNRKLGHNTIPADLLNDLN